MEVSSSHQIYVFSLCVLSGIMCGMFFDIQRFLRRLFAAGTARTMLEDVLFAFVCIGVMLGLSYRFNNGEIRYYEVMGSVSGALFYAAALSRLFMKLLQLLLAVITKLVLIPLVKICRILSVPVKKIAAISGKFFRKGRRILLSLGRNIKNRKKHLKKRIKML